MLLLPSPQLMTTVCVSSVPGSAKEPLSAVAPFSSMVAGFRLSCRLAGAILLTVTLVLESRWARSYVKSRLAALEAPKACKALNLCSACRSSKAILMVEGAVMVRMRAAGLAFKRSSRRLVSKNGPRWLVANMVS